MIDIQVEGEPEEDKLVTVEIELHRDSDLDAAQTAYIRVFSDNRHVISILHGCPQLTPMESSVASGHILRGQATLSKYAADGYWQPDQIRIWDAQSVMRGSHPQQSIWGWKLYIHTVHWQIDEPPKFMSKTQCASLCQMRQTAQGRTYIKLSLLVGTLIEKNGIKGVYAGTERFERDETYSRRGELGRI